jgi:hypothetical protein
MEPEGWLQCSQELSIGPDPGQEEYSTEHHTMKHLERNKQKKKGIEEGRQR